MLNLWATLEEWVIGDGNYPHFRKNDKVNLAFYIKPYNFSVTKNENHLFEQIKYSEYNFCGKIIYTYENIIVVDTNGFKFYMEIDDIEKNIVGNQIQGKGMLLVDYYVWAENLIEYKNHPNIFYNLFVEKIYLVTIPEVFIKRYGNSISFPSSLKNDDINDDDIMEIETTNVNHDVYEYYLIEFNEINEQVRKTFIL